MLELLQYQFIQRALVAGVFMGGTLSLLGVFVVLRKSAFFGDAIAHFAFAGIALGFLFSVNPVVAAVVTSLGLALAMGYIQNRTPVHTLDTIIGIFFSGAAALGIFVIGLLKGYRADLFQYLFGDIIAITLSDVIFSAIIAAGVVIVLFFTWKPFFKIIFNKEIARISGVRVNLYEYIFLGLLAAVTAVSIKIVGIILVPALLVIPAAAAKNISRNFRQMVFYSVVFGVGSVLFGLFGSLYFNTASGATIVLLSIVLFLVTLMRRGRV